MGFLDNVALRKTERNLRPFMRTDERIIEYDIANVANLGRNIPIVLTNRAIYFMGHTTIRLPYPHILDLQAQGQRRIGVATKSNNAYLIEIAGSPKGNLFGTVVHHLNKAVKHRETVDVPGGQVFAVCRQIDEDGPFAWLMQTSREVDLDDPAVKQALAEALTPAADRLRVPLADLS